MRNLSIYLVLLGIFSISFMAQAGTVQLPKTSQMTSYGVGDDGYYQKGVAWPSPRFTNNGDGSVTDNLTGLFWLKNANCFNTQPWTIALTSANSLASGSCGLTDGSAAGDWRLPNRRELSGLVDRSHSSPALTAGHPFTGVQSDFYWTSSTYADETSRAWVVFLRSGSIDAYHKTIDRYVWPVRGGQWPPAAYPIGDTDGNGITTVADSLLALRMAVGQTTPNLSRCDVAPLINGAPQPDSKITSGDALLILRKALGLVNW